MKRLLKFAIRVTARTLKDDLGAFSAHAAFFMTVSFIPFIMLMISMLRFLPFSMDELLTHALSVFPADTKTLVKTIIAESYEKSGTALISLTAISTLWSASIGVFSVTKGLDMIYSRSESRSYISMRLISMLYTLLLPLIFLLCLTMLVFGSSIFNTIKNSFPAVLPGVLIVMSLRSIIAFLVLTAFFAVMYKFVPKRKGKFLYQLPGAAVSGGGWMLFSAIFAFYYENISNYSYLYGSLSTLVFFMLWLFFCFYILFIGAEINKGIESGGII